MNRIQLEDKIDGIVDEAKEIYFLNWRHGKSWVKRKNDDLINMKNNTAALYFLEYFNDQIWY